MAIVGNRQRTTIAGMFIVACMLLLQVVISHSVSAMNNTGPDKADMGMASGVAAYVIADQTDSARIRNIRVPIYFTNNTSAKSVRVYDYDLCSSPRDTGNNYRDTGYSSSRSTNTAVTYYSLSGKSGWTSGSTKGTQSTAGNCKNASFVINIPNNRLVYDANIERYRINFDAAIAVTGIQNHFRLVASGASPIIGYSSSAAADSFGIAQDAPQPAYHQYSLPFAPDCSVRSNTRTSLRIYDDDNGTPFIQPSKFRMYINEYTAAGSYVGRVTINGGDISANSKVESSPNSNIWTITSGNRSVATVNFTVRPGYKYRWVLSSIYSVNLLQFQLPYDSIYFVSPCVTTVSRASSIMPSPTVEEGQTMTGRFSMTNTGPVPGTVNYTRYVWRDDNKNSSWNGGEARFPNASWDSGRVTINPGNTRNLSNWSAVADQATHGTRVCVGIRITPDNGTTRVTSSAWDIHCTSIGKKPKMHVMGGDVRVQGAINTSTSRITVGGTARTFGSWVEYGTFASGTVSDFGSGAVYSAGATSTSIPTYHKLTFANINNAGGDAFGNYGSITPAPMASQFMGGSTTSNLGASANLGSLASGTHRRSGNLTITASNVGQSGGVGKKIIVIATGTVTINGNISYAAPGGGFTSFRQLPQVIVIAPNITINNSVTSINAWLLTSGVNGTINTCSNVAVTAQLNRATCNNALKINGPVSTSKLYLRRTAGANGGAAAGDPAETLNLRADAYLWANQQASAAGKAQTVYTFELPPRF